MADFKDVVEMLGENLVSFLVLAKKLLVDWAIEPKKLLYALQNIRKEEFMGLVEGTHKIVVKEKQMQSIALLQNDDEFFEQIFESDYITIPDMATVVACIQKKWSKEMGSVTPSTVLETGSKKKVKVFHFKKSPSSQRCVNFIKNSQGAMLPNVYGLAIAEMTVGSQLPKNKWLLGFDNPNNLSRRSYGRRRVSCLCLDSNGGVRRTFRGWGSNWDIGCCLVVLSD